MLFFRKYINEDIRYDMTSLLCNHNICDKKGG